MPIIFAALTFFSTLLGGLVALRYKDKLHLILGFTAGVLLSVVAFDIFPGIIILVGREKFDPVFPMLFLVGGFLVFHILEKGILIHHSHEEEYVAHKHPTVGLLSALSLSAHSFLDGLGIGLSFQVSPVLGTLVAVAVVSHDFSDGLNTVTLMLLHKNTLRRSVCLLLLDALAPILGVLAAYGFSLSPILILAYLGFFAGFLLYIGAADILPEAHSQHSSWKTVLATVLGTVFIFLVSRMM